VEERRNEIVYKDPHKDRTVVNTDVVMGVAKGVVISHDANLLVENGGYTNIIKKWAQQLLQ